MLGKMGLRDQNNGKKVGINGSRIYHVTTLLSTGAERGEEDGGGGGGIH